MRDHSKNWQEPINCVVLVHRDSRQEIIRTLAAGAASGVSSNAASGTELNLPAEEWQHLLDRTAGFSGSDLSDLVKNALYQPVRELTTATHWVPVGKECGSVLKFCDNFSFGSNGPGLPGKWRPDAPGR